MQAALVAALAALASVTLVARVTAQEDQQAEDAGASAGSASETERTDVVDAPTEGAPAQAPAPGVRLQLQVIGGFGFGTRAFERPTKLGGQSLPTAYFPAVDVGVRVHVQPQKTFSLVVLLRYQTSVGMNIEERPPFALPNEVGARSERAELSIAPTLRLTDAENAPLLSFPVGAQIRTLWPDIHESLTPGYSLIGPHLRAELIAPIAGGLSVRLGPEVQWIVAIDRSIREDGVANQGIAFGAEGEVRLALGAVYALDVSYRESHATASSNNAGPVFSDVERFLVARFSGTL